MKPRLNSLVTTIVLALAVDSTLAETPLEWTNLRLKTQQGGNAEIELMRAFNGLLLIGKVRIHNSAAPIAVPRGCWTGERSIYFDNVLISHGVLRNEREFWKFSFNVDEPLSTSGLGRFYLVVDSDSFLSSYVEYDASNGEHVQIPICSASQ